MTVLADGAVNTPAAWSRRANELAVAIDVALAQAPRRYRIIHWLATHTTRVWLLGWILEALRQRSYERRVKSRVTLARQTVENRLPRRYRRALRGEEMVPSLRRST